MVSNYCAQIFRMSTNLLVGPQAPKWYRALRQTSILALFGSPKRSEVRTRHIAIDPSFSITEFTASEIGFFHGRNSLKVLYLCCCFIALTSTVNRLFRPFWYSLSDSEINTRDQSHVNNQKSHTPANHLASKYLLCFPAKFACLYAYWEIRGLILMVLLFCSPADRSIFRFICLYLLQKPDKASSDSSSRYVDSRNMPDINQFTDSFQ